MSSFHDYDGSSNASTNDCVSIPKKEAKLMPSPSQPYVDNPCWGGPQLQQHNLSYLLELISSGKFNIDASNREETIILHNDNDFLVVDKPPDLRMDGSYPASVHKLVTYWFPPPSLTQSIFENAKSKDGDILLLNEAKHRTALLDKISKLKTFSDLPDNIIRTTHQLDYATSGVLLMAKSKKAAGTACKAFNNRSTKKEYLSIVHNKIDKEIPILNSDQEKIFQQWMDGTLEKKHRKQRREAGSNSSNSRKGKTFLGYLPAHSVFSKWKALKQRKRKRKRDDEINGKSDCKDSSSHQHSDREKSSKSSSIPIVVETAVNAANGVSIQKGHISHRHHRRYTSESADALLLKPLSGFPDRESENILLELSWNEIKLNQKYKSVFYDLTKAYNEQLESVMSEPSSKADQTNKSKEEEIDESDSFKVSTLPTFFRRRGESEDAFYCQAALAEDPTGFRVWVKPEALKDCSSDIQSKYGRSYTENGEELDFKPSLTRCVVLKRGFWNDLPVTKMLLQPWTGRRHQLRLHTAIFGHAILGDCTYELGDDREERKTCNRMCLHAHKLSIPLGYKKIKVFTAPDPFVGVI